MPKLPEGEALAKAKAGLTKVNGRAARPGCSDLSAPLEPQASDLLIQPTNRNNRAPKLPRPKARSRFPPVKQFSGHELGAEGLRATDGLPETACAYAFAKCAFHRQDFRARAMPLDGGVLSGINKGPVCAGDDQVRLALTKLRRKLCPRRRRPHFVSENLSRPRSFLAEWGRHG